MMPIAGFRVFKPFKAEITLIATSENGEGP